MPTVLWLLLDFLSLKNVVNVPSKSNKQKTFFLICFCWALEGPASGSISQRYGSADPDPHQNVMDPEHCWQVLSALSGVEPPECLRLTHNMVDKLLKISGSVTGLDCIVVDDMLDTGATARLALEVLQIHGARYTSKPHNNLFYIFNRWRPSTVQDGLTYSRIGVRTYRTFFSSFFGFLFLRTLFNTASSAAPGIESRTVVTLGLAVGCSNHSAWSCLTFSWKAIELRNKNTN